MGKLVGDDLKRSRKALSEAVQNTLETLAFQEAMPIEAGSYDELSGPIYVTTVEMKRPYAGVIRLFITRAAARNLISSMLGNPEQLDEEWLQDGLSELVNTIGGRVVAQLVDTQSSFDLSIPTSQLWDKALPPRFPAGIRQAFMLDDQTIELELDFAAAQAA
jgi:CheY-specific phosphatase CheX